ncbi:MAG TPA: hypothetical protein VFI47_16150 [Acidimicrobiales bacterium]|nr:hypothetical protein [Acidimicrobiales bacterium]
MSELWTFQVVEYVTPRTESTVPPELAGYAVEAREGHVGKVDEATYEAGSSYLVVDTGFWIFGKKRMIPAGVIGRIDHDERKVYVSLTEDQIKRAPDYEEARREQEAYRQELADYYEGARAR